MLAIEVIVPQSAPRLWQQVAIERLEADGHDVAVLHHPGTASWPAAARAAFLFEQRLFRRRGPGLAAPLLATALRRATAGDLARLKSILEGPSC